jgi:tRNA modification GTPase
LRAMAYEVHDTIAAIASPAGGASRGIVRISGPEAIVCVARCFEPADGERSIVESLAPRRAPGAMRIGGEDEFSLAVPGELLIWPSARSYTREPAAEFHTLGSLPLLAAVVEQLSKAGARPAAPGEFTLRAFLAGRIDLTQAEAVLGVIDARDRSDLDAALDQMAGGLSRPLHVLREQLLAVMAELEAGLDFVEEDIEFISRDVLRERLDAGRAVVAATLEQMAGRDVANELPRVVITGRPNAGKSSLFNALVKWCGVSASVEALVSPQPGATRDYLVAEIDLDGVRALLIDTAGVGERVLGAIDEAAQTAAGELRRRADVRLVCLDGCDAAVETLSASLRANTELVVVTKADLRDSDDGRGGGTLCVSSLTGARLSLLAQLLKGRLVAVTGVGQGSAAAATAARCSQSLRIAETALAAAVALVDAGSEELIAAEIRAALNALGEVVGAVCTDDILDRVFSQFCIGK